MFIANTHDYILCFQNRGRGTGSRVYEVPEGGRNSRGKPIVNLFPGGPREDHGDPRSPRRSPDKFVFMATSRAP